MSPVTHSAVSLAGSLATSRRAPRLGAALLLTVLSVCGCSGDSGSNGNADAGGASTGGTSGTGGGTATTGGASGSATTGGASTGGTSSSGGTATTGGTSGSGGSTPGGAPSGGATSAGGLTGAGGTTGACTQIGTPCNTTAPECCPGLLCVGSTSADYAGCRQPCAGATDCASGCCIPFSNIPDKGFCGDALLCQCAGLDETCGGARSCCSGFTCTTFDATNALACKPVCTQNADCTTNCCVAIPGTTDSACLPPSFCGR